MEFGPVQMLVVGFKDPTFSGTIVEELRRLSDHEVIRLIDLLVVNRTDTGELEAMEVSGLTDEEARQFGAKVGALIGFGAAGDEGLEAGAEMGAAMGQAVAEDGMYSEEEVLDVAEEIPPGTAAAIALIEHRWAIPLRDKIVQQGGLPLVDAWIHPTDLIASGMAAKAQSDLAT